MQRKIQISELAEANVHYGHLARKWNPNFAPYVYAKKNGIHVINLYKTAFSIETACTAIRKIVGTKRKILFISTKKQARSIVADMANKVEMPYITERWQGGMLTNFITIRKAIKKITSIDKMKKDGSFDTLSKKEQLQVTRSRAKLEKNLGSIANMTRLPGALFIVDIAKEHLAVAEAKKLGIPVFAIVDSNSDPTTVDFPIPANDDTSRSIEKILSYIADSIEEEKASLKNQASSSEAPEQKPSAENTVKEVQDKEENSLLS